MTKDITKVHICIWQTVADKDPSFGGSKLLLESPPHDLEDWIRVCSEIRRVNKNPVCAFRAAKQAGLAFVHVGLTINGCEHGLTCETPDPLIEPCNRRRRIDLSLGRTKSFGIR